MGETIQTNIRLTKKERDFLSSLGKGCISSGIRSLMHPKSREDLPPTHEEKVIELLENINSNIIDVETAINNQGR